MYQLAITRFDLSLPSCKEFQLTLSLIYTRDFPTQQDNNALIEKFSPEQYGPLEKRTDILAHHEVLLRLGAVDLERGAKVAGHRGYYLTGPGVRLNQALINYGMDWLEKRNFTLVQTPFFMQKPTMAKTAQLDEFDEALYHVSARSS
jgi:seryl-tRNA synthetase